MENYCTQVKEHLEIFATLKGVEEDVLVRVVTDMVDQVSSFADSFHAFLW